MKITSLTQCLEKLQEAEHFLTNMTMAEGLAFRACLNGFLAAARSATLYLQKSFKGVDGFEAWYGERQDEMRADQAMSFFLELRNISQHEGPVSYIRSKDWNSTRWTHRFAGNREAVPQEVLGVEIVQACAEHMLKVARLLLSCHDKFPFASCPVAACSPEGLAATGRNLPALAVGLGYPIALLVGSEGIPKCEIFRILAEEFEPFDLADLRRITRGDWRKDGVKFDMPAVIHSKFADDIAALVEAGEGDFRKIVVAAALLGEQKH